MRILRGVGSRMLPCWCLVGIYEAYDTNTVALIDARGLACMDTGHHVDAGVPIDLISPLRHSPVGADNQDDPRT